jgi:hypothetical protein
MRDEPWEEVALGYPEEPDPYGTLDPYGMLVLAGSELYGFEDALGKAEELEGVGMDTE